MNSKLRSEKIQARRQVLKHLLKAYEKSNVRLHDAAQGRLSLKNKRYTFGAENYQRTSLDEQRLPWTLNNPKSPMRLYQHELEVVQDYGN